ncbi:hypothetical protein [Oricola sp.]|uniref:hypothetical protein n=1 Tax=Oricola sp. TaxID=1979950 RepID=UPI0025DF1950|nr:hypothetical protein [Oricola sp.]MCI5078375.1 hypothetical protein [Oricola sp.]
MRHWHEATSDARADGGFGAIMDAAAIASQRIATHRLDIRLAGERVELVVAGDDLAAHVMPVFAHLAEPDSPNVTAERTVTFLDARAAGGAALPASTDGEWVLQGDGWQVSTHGNGRYLSEVRDGSLICLDRATGSVAALFEAAEGLSLADRARPLQRMMSQICLSCGAQNIHGGLVARDGVGALIVGGSGRGKTTTSIDCLLNGLDFLGDDSVAIRETEHGSFSGYSLYGSTRVHPHQVARWPEILDDWRMPAPGDDKALLLPGTIAAGRMARQCEIRAILVPRITDGVFRAIMTSPRASFSALVHDSEETRRFQMSPAEFHRFARLTRETPCFLCDLDAEPAAVAAGVADILREVTT